MTTIYEHKVWDCFTDTPQEIPEEAKHWADGFSRDGWEVMSMSVLKEKWDDTTKYRIHLFCRRPLLPPPTYPSRRS